MLADEKEKQSQNAAQLAELQKQNECITASKEQLEQQLSEALKQNESITAGKSELENLQKQLETLKKENEALKNYYSQLEEERGKAVQNEYLNSQLAAAAYEKSSIILPDNPVIL